MILAMLLYSASVEDFLILGYFFDFQEMGEDPIKMQNPVIDFLVIEQVAQSASL